MESNNLLDNLKFKTLTMPTWFGKTREDMTLVQEATWEFFRRTLISDVVEKLLDTEPSPEYWYQADVWPYPDTAYLTRLCAIMDEHMQDFPLHVRTFYFGYLTQYIHYEVWAQLPYVHTQRIKNQ